VTAKSTSVHLKSGEKSTVDVLGKITGMLKCIADKLCVCRLKFLNLWAIVGFFYTLCKWKIYSSVLKQNRGK